MNDFDENRCHQLDEWFQQCENPALWSIKGVSEVTDDAWERTIFNTKTCNAHLVEMAPSPAVIERIEQ